ncbi:hypothetical protein ZYGR_0R00900 [Zygosaccharomyces rouxii]|uniref:ZYRO0F02112p n=2 Tax=Zygosaccharomyces rouxii TaxID=4956 RepID=C5DX44_ZYGRC|nr:uncharacterized protein ZYRO0F02112g [Zygosaccharomyces rouxii]KAH9199118.1 hypothetical protein LQ764DRAFT_227536 [Zygosaccharomyces rouxii]GAV49847.1 hypothetical protein ZYGR_0R00900 [Zygosaccharomyces rouxii]CAR28355.1 ZYRO0F02112p [Zygosaccharomyces rouxii]
MESEPLSLPSYNDVYNSDVSKSELAQKLPPPYHVNSQRKRTMPIVHSIGERGPRLFLSEESLNKYRHTNFHEQYLVNLQNAGIPLFQFLKTSRFKRMIGKSSFVINKYLLQKLETGVGDEKPILTDGTYGLYKIPFCWIFRKKKGGKTTYTFRYSEGTNVSEHELIEDHNEYSGMLNGDEFRYASPDGNFDKLLLILGSNAVSGLYTREDCDYLMVKHSKLAHIILSESPGDQISTTTLLLACQGLLINHLVRNHFFQGTVANRPPPRSAVWDPLWQDQ